VESAQAGSADMSIGMRAGAAPLKSTTPVMEPASAGAAVDAGADAGCVVSLGAGAVVCLQPASVKAAARRIAGLRRFTVLLWIFWNLTIVREDAD
jgi:hypothetical protein